MHIGVEETKVNQWMNVVNMIPRSKKNSVKETRKEKAAMPCKNTSNKELKNI